MCKVLKCHHLPFSRRSLHPQLYLQHQPGPNANLQNKHKFHLFFAFIWHKYICGFKFTESYDISADGTVLNSWSKWDFSLQRKYILAFGESGCVLHKQSSNLIIFRYWHDVGWNITIRITIGWEFLYSLLQSQEISSRLGHLQETKFIDELKLICTNSTY